MAPHSSTPTWKIPWMEEPGGLQSMGLLRVGHDWVTSLSLSTFMLWRRKWQPTPVFLPGESQGWRSLVGCLWGRTESDTTEATQQQQQQQPNVWFKKKTTLAIVWRGSSLAVGIAVMGRSSKRKLWLSAVLVSSSRTLRKSLDPGLVWNHARVGRGAHDDWN